MSWPQTMYTGISGILYTLDGIELLLDKSWPQTMYTPPCPPETSHHMYPPPPPNKVKLHFFLKANLGLLGWKQGFSSLCRPTLSSNHLFLSLTHHTLIISPITSLAIIHHLPGTRPRTLEYRPYHYHYLEPDLTTWTIPANLSTATQ